MCPCFAAIQVPRSAFAPNKPATPENSQGSLAIGLLRAQIVHKLAQVKDSDGNVISSVTNFSLDRDLSHLNVYGATSTFTMTYDSTNKKIQQSDIDSYFLGTIPVGVAAVDLGVSAVGTVNLDALNLTTDDTVYFYVTAVNTSGRESEPSDIFNSSGANPLINSSHIGTAVITTAHIGTAQITDALIDTLGVNKLTSGTVSAKQITLATASGVDSYIQSSNYSSGSQGFKITSDGNIEANSGNFRGDISGASGTFTGSITGASGTFGGNLSGGTIDIGGSDSSSFHVDTDGDMWLGAANYVDAPFRVAADGDAVAGNLSVSSISVTGGEIHI